MTYNIHPILVHFPIALLFLYSIVKIVPWQRWFPQVAWKHIERVLLLLGFLGACAALLTGETAKHMVRPDHALVEMHSLFAQISTFIYGLLLLGEILVVQTLVNLEKFAFVQKLLTHPVLSRVLALFGLIAITITGMLGGVMVYGLTADPLAPIVLKLLGLHY